MSVQHWNPTPAERWNSVAVVAGAGPLAHALVSTLLMCFFFLLFALQIVPRRVTDKKRAWQRVGICVIIDMEMVLDERHLIGRLVVPVS
jgi:hypothetical protein